MENISENGRAWPLSLFFGLSLGAGCLLLTSALAAAVIYFTPISDFCLPKIALALDAAALFAAAYAAAASRGRRGLLLGALVAGAALLIMLPLGSCEMPVKQAVICALSALAGGVLGVR